MDKIADNSALVIIPKLTVLPNSKSVTIRITSSEKLSFALQLRTKLHKFCIDTLWLVKECERQYHLMCRIVLYLGKLFWNMCKCIVPIVISEE